MKDIVKNEIKRCFEVLWGFIAIVASAGAMNTGEGIYIAAGIANILINGYAIYKHTKRYEKE